MTAIPASRRPTPARSTIVTVAVVVAVAVLAAAVYAAGGFAQRSDRLVRSPGEEIDAGNLIFTVDSATAQRDDTLARHPWTVRVSGTVRNPHERTLRPLTGEQGNLFARDHAGGTVETLAFVQLGGSSARTQVPPDGRPLDLVAEFDFADFEPGPTLDVAVARMEFTDNAVLGLGGGEKNWNTDSAALLQMVTVPLTVLAPKS